MSKDDAPGGFLLRRLKRMSLQVIAAIMLLTTAASQVHAQYTAPIQTTENTQTVVAHRFRAIKSGSWTNSAIWQIDVGGRWQAAPEGVYPGHPAYRASTVSMQQDGVVDLKGDIRIVSLAVDKGELVVNGLLTLGKFTDAEPVASKGDPVVATLEQPRPTRREAQLPSITPVSKPREIPQLKEESGLKLDQNYPNPIVLAANPVTMVSFTLDKDYEWARIRVVDELGRSMMTTMELPNPHVGEHRMQLNVGRLTTGRYILRLETPSGAVQRVMTVVK